MSNFKVGDLVRYKKPEGDVRAIDDGRQGVVESLADSGSIVVNFRYTKFILPPSDIVPAYPAPPSLPPMFNVGDKVRRMKPTGEGWYEGRVVDTELKGAHSIVVVFNDTAISTGWVGLFKSNGTADDAPAHPLERIPTTKTSYRAVWANGDFGLVRGYPNLDYPNLKLTYESVGKNVSLVNVEYLKKGET